MKAIEINNLDFSYNQKEAILQDINMNVPSGSIYGFLGPNGAGKTTTLKLILSLLRNKGNGTINTFGNDISMYSPSYLNRIGSLIEEASVYSHLTAKQNLKIWSNYYNTKATRSDEVLDIVGLRGTKNKKVQDFSTGMKQRLGLGISLMHDPDILILDEPTNGLDPMGINDLRELLRNLSAQGKTILLSSHILPEVEKLVDHVGIIKNGSMVFEGSLKQLNGMTLDSHVLVLVDNAEKAKQILEKQFPTQNMEERLLIKTSNKGEINQIVRLLLDHDIQLYELNQPKKSLETIFMKLAK